MSNTRQPTRAPTIDVPWWYVLHHMELCAAARPESAAAILQCRDELATAYGYAAEQAAQSWRAAGRPAGRPRPTHNPPATG